MPPGAFDFLPRVRDSAPVRRSAPAHGTRNWARHRVSRAEVPRHRATAPELCAPACFRERGSPNTWVPAGWLSPLDSPNRHRRFWRGARTAGGESNQQFQQTFRFRSHLEAAFIVARAQRTLRCGPEPKFARGACRPRLQRPRRSTAMAECGRRGPRVRRVWRLPGLPTLVPSRPQLTLFWPGAQNPLSRHLAQGSRIEERLSTQSAGWLRSVGFTRKHVARVTVAVPGTGREGSGDPLRISSDFCSSSQ